MSSLELLRTEIFRQAALHKEIALMTHIEPDGDGICAIMALHKILEEYGYTSTIITDDDDLSKYDHLLDPNCLAEYNDTMRFDLVIVVDCNSTDRIGTRANLLQDAKYTIVIDHHLPEHRLIPADFAYIEPAFATAGMIIYECLEQDIIALGHDAKAFIGSCIYTTILNDTNNFSNANTNAAVFNVSARLSDLGIEPHKLHKAFFLNQSPQEIKYIGQTLATIELHLDERVLVMYSSKAIELENGIDARSLPSVTRYVQGVRGLSAIVYLQQDENSTWKVSLRSTVINVNTIAVKHGGGGHRSASGCKISGSLDEVKAILLKDIAIQMESI